VLDDHTPFQRRGVPAIDLIDFTFDCWHRKCDDLSAVSARSLDYAGETVTQMLLDFRR
jgi:glutaminyl-peptide cyclotransferase